MSAVALRELRDVSPAVNARRELAWFFSRVVTLICSCRPRELRAEVGHVECANCGARIGRAA